MRQKYSYFAKYLNIRPDIMGTINIVCPECSTINAVDEDNKDDVVLSLNFSISSLIDRSFSI